MPDVETSPFGRGLRHWRRLRGVSQLDLASTAATTTRHVSFLETGRSRPSRQMVDRLGDALQIPCANATGSWRWQAWRPPTRRAI